MAETNETIIIPAFLASDDSTISLMDLGGYCGEAGCCTTECSQYCMSCTSSQGGGCGESCGESCGETCGETCGESCGESCSSQTPSQAFEKDIWPYVSLSSTATSITVYVSPAVSAIFDAPGANYCNISCNNVNSGVISTGTSYTFYGLSPGSSYSIIVDVMYAAQYNGNYGYDSGIGYTLGIGIDPWDWNFSELNAFNNNGNFSVLTADRWNEFCDKINEACIAADSSWLTNFTTLSGAKASGPGAPLTALMFMSVKFNIGSRVPTHPPIPVNINTGDTIYGSYFITLQEKLNEWIASL